MKNADLFQKTFGFYATELWAMSQGEFLAWLNSDQKTESTPESVIKERAAIDAMEEKMKYLAIFDDEFLQNFRKDGLTLVLNDKAGATRGVQLKPLIKPVVINEKSGESVYITDEHIKVLQDYETGETIKKIIKETTLFWNTEKGDEK